MSKCELSAFEKWGAQKKKLSPRTIETYVHHIESFFKSFSEVTDETLDEWKTERIDELKSASYINVGLRAMSAYIEFLGIDVEIPKSVPTQKQQFLDDVITRADYDFLLKYLKGKFGMSAIYKYERLYIAIKIIGTTGLRISELLNVKHEDIELGVFDIYGKRSKQRRIYIPKSAQEDLLHTLHSIGIYTGYVVVDKNRNKMKLRSLQDAFTRLAEETEIDKSVMHAHSFRHFFAKEFIKHHNDICALADLLGHSNLNTTRIYLKLTSREQKELVDKVVDW